MSSFRFLRTMLAPNALRARPLAQLARANLRPSYSLRETSIMTAKRSFTVNLPRFSSGNVDPDLVHLLEEELQFENNDDKVEAPAFVKEFLETNLFQIDDKMGHDKVTLTRNFGNEKINVIFSISDINNTVEEYTEQDEEQQEEEAEKIQQENPSEVDDDKKEIDAEEELVSFPVRATVTIEKEGKGCLVLNTVAQDGYLHVDAVRHFKQGEFDLNNESVGGQRQDLYMGPVFEELEEDIQTTFCRYLEERGIDTALATFLPDYVDYKEQQEYVNWLRQVNDFVSA